MWIILLGFIASTLTLGWLLCGYLIWLRFAGDARQPPPAPPPTRFPRLSIVVTCLNEADIIAEKYLNIVAAQYPPDRLEIVFADGGSRDRTVQRLRGVTAQDARVSIIERSGAGKIRQLNAVLPHLTGEIVVVTDSDARLAPDALAWMVAEFENDPSVGVVGACTAPRGGIPVERCYWAAQNRVRFLESRVSHVSIVAACGYAFRREIVSSFPGDVIADDVYTVIRANTEGYRTVYSPKALVEEWRTPSSLSEFFTHKFRKSNAVLREMLRVCYRLPELSGHWKWILATSLAQQILLPWVTLLWIAFAATLANFGQWDAAGMGLGVLVAGVLATRKAVHSVEVPAPAGRFGIITTILAFTYTLGVLLTTGITYVMFRQSSQYARLSGIQTEKSDRKQKSSQKAADAMLVMPQPG